VSSSLIYQAVAEGRLAATRLSGSGRRGKIVISDEALQAFIEANTVRQLSFPDEEDEWP